MDHFEDLDAVGMIILKYTLEKWRMTMWIALIWLRIKTNGMQDLMEVDIHHRVQ
jgi:hypothetical protein